MTSWDAVMLELQGEYLREAPERLLRGRAALERLGREPEAAALPDLARVFHAFAGSGTTYGFTRVSELGLQGEHLCGQLETGTPSAQQLDECRQLLEGIEQSLRAPQAPAQGASPPPAGPTEPAAPTQPTVLLIEDEPAHRELLRRALERDALNVVCAGSLAEAQQALLGPLPDGIVADVVLPDGEIFGLIERLRLRPGAEELPIIVNSIRAQMGDRTEAIHCGADAYFTKPLDVDVVVRRLQFLLARERQAPPRVLSVEDDPLQAAFLRTVLESAGYVFEWCSDPDHLDSALAAFHPDLVLMDVVLPFTTGYDLSRTLRLDETYALLPVVFLTTQGQIKDRLAVTRAGGSDHLLKPVHPEVLLATIAARLEQARFVHSLVDHDGLTGILTHSALFERAAALMTQVKRRGANASWIMIDVDHFKSVNDRYGHAVGDRVLRALSALLRRRLRQSDVLGRYGGEEFAAVLADLTSEAALGLVDRLREEFAQMVHEAPGGQGFSVTFSAGIAALTSADTVGEWSQAADRSLYAAKTAGRNRVVLEPRSDG